MKRHFVFAVLVFSLPVAAWAQAAPATSNGSVTDLGTMGTQGSFAYAVSAKGEVVVGASPDAHQWWRAFRWTAAGGMQDLDPNGDDSVTAHANGISADANVIVGDYGHYPECNPGCAFLWTTFGGFEFLPDLPSGWYSPTSQGVSKDGGVLVGWAHQSYGGPDHAWRYTGLTGFVDLGALPNSCCGSQALAVSQDGNVVVGYSYDANMHQHAFRWTQKSGLQDLGFLPGGSFSIATGASTNGSVVVGYADTTINCPPGLSRCNVPFRWTKAGMVPLGLLPGEWWTGTAGVSADGKTVVGYDSQNCCNWVAWRWTQATGKQNINDWLADVGVDATAFSFYSAYAVTANGNGVVGQLTTGDAYLALAKTNKTCTPTYSPKPGTYHSPQSVTIIDMAPNAAIYYTTDGSTPTTNSTPYTVPIQVSVTTTIKSIAIAPGYPKSAVATGVYKIK